MNSIDSWSTSQVIAGDTAPNTLPLCHLFIFPVSNTSILTNHSPIYATHIRFLLHQHSISSSHGLIMAYITMFQNTGKQLHYQNHLGSFMNYIPRDFNMLFDGRIKAWGFFVFFSFLKFTGCGNIFSRIDSNLQESKNQSGCLCFFFFLKQNVTQISWLTSALPVHFCFLQRDLFKDLEAKL